MDFDIWHFMVGSGEMVVDCSPVWCDVLIPSDHFYTLCIPWIRFRCRVLCLCKLHCLQWRKQREEEWRSRGEEKIRVLPSHKKISKKRRTKLLGGYHISSYIVFEKNIWGFIHFKKVLGADWDTSQVCTVSIHSYNVFQATFDSTPTIHCLTKVGYCQ